jgi:hypothetical protein
MPTITSNWGFYDGSGTPYWAVNNAWNGAAPGTQWIDYNTSSTFPDGTTINWNYGNQVANWNVWGYPEVVYGDQNGGSSYGGISSSSITGVEPPNVGEQISTLDHFNFTWNVSLTGQPASQYDVLAETHLGIQGQTHGAEFGIVLNSPSYMTQWLDGFTMHQFNAGGTSVELIPGLWGTGTLGVVPDSVLHGTPMTQGTIDLAPILQDAVQQGWLAGTDTVQGWELGVNDSQSV